MSLRRHALRVGCYLAPFLLGGACGRAQEKAGTDGGRNAESGVLAGSAPSLRVALIADLEGVLEPCGCTRGSLGGVDRLAHQLQVLRSDGIPVFVLAAGNLMTAAENSDLTVADSALRAQEALKADVVAALLVRLKVDVVAPGPRDLSRTEAPLLHLLRGRRVALLGRAGVDALEGMAPQLERQVGTQRVRLVDASGSHGTDPESAREPDRALTISVTHREPIATPSKRRAVDIAVHTGSAQMRGRAQVRAGAIELTGARQGRELLVLELWPEGAAQDAWQLVHTAPAEPRRNLARVQHFALDAQVPAAPDVRRFLQQSFARINALRVDSGLAALDEAPVPTHATYVGARTCAACHTQAYVWWLSTPHARAYQTLEKRGRELDLDCIGCHVTGYGRPGGASVGRLGELGGVGCESCHGPGGAHVDDPRPPHRELSRSAPEALCLRCHDAQHSDDFRYENKQALLRVPGHGDARQPTRFKPFARENGAP